MFAMFTVKCGSLRCDGPCERFLWIAAVKECSWCSKCYWKWISQTLVSSNIPRWTGGHKPCEWWMVCAVSRQWTWGEWNLGVIWDRNNKTAQNDIIQFVSRELGCRDRHCVSARSAVSANPLLSLLILWLETSQRHPEKARIPVKKCTQREIEPISSLNPLMGWSLFRRFQFFLLRVLLIQMIQQRRHSWAAPLPLLSDCYHWDPVIRWAL